MSVVVPCVAIKLTLLLVIHVFVNRKHLLSVIHLATILTRHLGLFVRLPRGCRILLFVVLLLEQSAAVRMLVGEQFLLQILLILNALGDCVRSRAIDFLRQFFRLMDPGFED